MWELLKKQKRLLLAVAAIFVAIIIYSMNLRNREHATIFERVVITVSAPFMGVVADANGRLQTVWNDYISLVGVRQENKTLRESVKVMNRRVLESQEAIIANERLKKLLDLKSSLQLASIAANVIGEESAPWYRTIVIDRGGVDGLEEGMPVVATSGIVGRLIKVSPNSSRVLLLTDHSSSIAAIIQRSRARGVVKGKGGGACSLEFALREEDVKVGDTVISSGIGGIFPKGLAIGEVSMVHKGEYGMFQSVDIRTAVNISRLEEVLVLLHRPE
jgi:rod shape-determining protein MreC